MTYAWGLALIHILTFASLLLPVFGDSYTLMLLSFSLLGIGNALMQTSLNPLLSNIVRGDRLASSLTFGQFVKAIASFLAPYIAMWGATQAIPSFGLGWRVLFPIYMVIAVIAVVLLGQTQMAEEKEEGKPSTFGECLALLGKPFVSVSYTHLDVYKRQPILSPLQRSVSFFRSLITSTP